LPAATESFSQSAIKLPARMISGQTARSFAQPIGEQIGGVARGATDLVKAPFKARSSGGFSSQNVNMREGLNFRDMPTGGLKPTTIPKIPGGAVADISSTGGLFSFPANMPATARALTGEGSLARAAANATGRGISAGARLGGPALGAMAVADVGTGAYALGKHFDVAGKANAAAQKYIPGAKQISQLGTSAISGALGTDAGRWGVNKAEGALDSADKFLTEYGQKGTVGMAQKGIDHMGSNTAIGRGIARGSSNLVSKALGSEAGRRATNVVEGGLNAGQSALDAPGKAIGTAMDYYKGKAPQWMRDAASGYGLRK
jgi:hypothetical protein